MKKWRNSAIYRYLDENGILENGSPEEIKEARRKYRLGYYKQHKQEKRNSGRELTIGLTEHERNRLAAGAKKHGLKITRFLKESALAYLSQSFLVIDRSLVIHIERLLMQAVEEIRNLSGKDWIRRPFQYQALEDKVEHLHNELTKALKQPKKVETPSDSESA